MDRDGTRSSFILALTRTVVVTVGVPVIASGGVGTLEHLVEGVRAGGASAVLAPSIFHGRVQVHPIEELAPGPMGPILLHR